MAQNVVDKKVGSQDYIFDMKTKIYNYLIAIKDNPETQDEFIVANSLYSEIVKFTSYEEIRTYYNKLYNEALNHVEYKEYNKLMVDLKDEKDKTRRTVIHDRLKVLVRRINGRHNVLTFIDEYIKKVTKGTVTKKSVKPQEKTSVVKPVQNKPQVTAQQSKPKVNTDDLPAPITETKEEKKPVNSNDPLNNYINFSTNIIRLLDRYNSLDKNTSEALKVRMKINDALDKREQSLVAKFGDVVMINLSVIESLEERISRLPLNDNTKPYEMTSEQYNKELKNIISRINDYDFYGINSEYFVKDNSKSDGVNESKLLKEREQLVRRFHNMIESLYGKDTAFEGLDGVKIEDIIPMLSTCNLNGGFKEFKKCFKDKKIGSENISKEMYEERFKKLNLYIDLLCTTSSEKISKNGNKVIISNHQKTRKDLMGELETEYKAMLYNMIVKMRKTNDMGGQSVHR